MLSPILKFESSSLTFVGDYVKPRQIRVSRTDRFLQIAQGVSDQIFHPLLTPVAHRYAKDLKLPAHFVELLLLVEDKRFPFHFGLDLFAVIRAALFNSKNVGAMQGASTISQQLYDVARERLGYRRERTLTRKLLQSVFAVRTSVTTPKVEVLRRYLQNVYWGRSYYGLEAAAAGYFGTRPTSLSPGQSLFLVERLASPNRVSILRLAVLLRRVSIRLCLCAHGGSVRQALAVYSSLLSSGGSNVPARGSKALGRS